MSTIFDSLHKDNYHFISLGYSCSVAMDLGSIGLRQSSYPFDWLISSFSGVIDCIENGFCDFLSEEFLFQSKKEPWKYLNKKYHIWFVHDFDENKSLKSQLLPTTEKYKRRCGRFLLSLKEKCVFFRYIHNQEDVDYIINNYEHIKNVLNIDCENRIIVFLAGKKGIDYKSLTPLFFSKPGKKNTVGKHPIIDNKQLTDALISVSSLDSCCLKKNKQHYKNGLINSFKRFSIKINRKIRYVFGRFYHHSKTIN